MPGENIAEYGKELAQDFTSEARLPDTGYEDKVTRSVEAVSKEIPSSGLLGLAVCGMAASTLLHLLGSRKTALYIGQWVPTILVMGVYNKLVKLSGKVDRFSIR